MSRHKKETSATVSLMSGLIRWLITASAAFFLYEGKLKKAINCEMNLCSMQLHDMGVAPSKSQKRFDLMKLPS